MENDFFKANHPTELLFEGFPNNFICVDLGLVELKSLCHFFKYLLKISQFK